VYRQTTTTTAINIVQEAGVKVTHTYGYIVDIYQIYASQNSDLALDIHPYFGKQIFDIYANMLKMTTS